MAPAKKGKARRATWYSVSLVLLVVPKPRRRGKLTVWENILIVQAGSAAAARATGRRIGRLHRRRSEVDADIEFLGVRVVREVLPSPLGRARWNERLESGAEVACNMLEFGSRAQLNRFLGLERAKVELLS